MDILERHKTRRQEELFLWMDFKAVYGMRTVGSVRLGYNAAAAPVFLIIATLVVLPPFGSPGIHGKPVSSICKTLSRLEAKVRLVCEGIAWHGV